MIGFGFGSRRKPREFNYKPIYWDEEAEEREARKKAAMLEDPNYVYKEDEYVPGSIIRAGRMRRMKSAQKNHTKSASTLIRTLVFLVLLGAIMFFFADSISMLF